MAWLWISTGRALNSLKYEQYQLLRTTAQELYKQGLYRSAKIGLKVASHKNDAIRTDEILWLENNETNTAIQFYLEQIKQLLQLFNQSLFLGLNEFETHFANYQPGTFYKKHIDEYGGALMLYNKEEQLLQQVAPLENRFICFNSELPHEVSITHQPRYSLTGWMKTRALEPI